jgi:hypothetical protein
VPEQLDLHWIAATRGTHRHARLGSWLAGRPRLRLHRTPTHPSRLNLAGRWLGLVAQQAMRRGSLNYSVTDLKRKINDFVRHYHRHYRPFMWTAAADSIPRESRTTLKSRRRNIILA